MPTFDASDLDYYTARRADAAPPPQPEQSMASRIWSHLYNLPKNASAATGEMLGGVGDFLTGKPDIIREDEQQQRQQGADQNFLYSSRYVAPANTTGEKVVDILGGGIAPQLPSLLLPGGAIARGGRALGAGAATASFLGEVGAGTLSGLQDSPQEAAVQGGEFALMNAAGALVPRGARPLMRAAAQGAAGAAIPLLGQAARGNNPFTKESLTQAGVMAAMPFAMEGKGLLRRGEPRVAPTPSTEATPSTRIPGVPDTWKLRRVVETPEGKFDHYFDTPHGEEIVPHESQVGEPEMAEPTFQTVGEPYGINPRPQTRKLLRQFHGVEEGDIEGQFTREAPKQLGAPQESNTGTALPGTSQLMGRPFAEGERGFTTGESATPPYTPEVITPLPRPQLGDRAPLRPLNSGEAGAVSRPLVNTLAGGTAGALAGGLYPGTDEEKRNRAIMWGVLGAGAVGTKQLMRAMRSPEGQKQATNVVKGQGKTMLGRATRVAERQFHLGRDSSLDFIQSGARGSAAEVKERMNPLLQEATKAGNTMDAHQRASLEIYLGSDRSAGPKALLDAAGIPDPVKRYLYESEKADDAAKAQMIQAEPDPGKRKIMQSTMRGQYQRISYEAFHNPEAWQKHGVEPDLMEKIISDNEKLPDYQGMTRDQIRKDTEDYFGSVATHGHENFGQPGATRMSRNIFTKRKEIRPLIQDALGKIKDPVARQAITTATLTEQAATAKIINDLHRIPDEKGRKQLINEDQLAADYEAARASGDKDHLAYLDALEQVPEIATLGTMSQGAVPGMKPAGVGNEQYAITQRKYDAKMAEAVAAGDTAAINRLKSYVPHEAKATMYATRHVMDMMKAGPAHSGVGWLETLLKPLAKIQSFAKGSFTLYNLGTHLHNWFQGPITAMANGVSPVTFVRGKIDPARIEKFKKLGLMDSHHGAQEFVQTQKSAEALLTPSLYDKAMDVHEAVKRGYGKSDQLVRMHTANRYMDEGAAAGLKGEALDRYTYEMTSRYTPDYSTVIPAVKTASNIPLINPFLRYTAEMTRIVKNLAEDVISDPMKAKWGIGKRSQSTKALALYLGLGAGLTELLSNLNLSPEEKEKWSSLLPLMPPYARNRSRVKLGYNSAKDQSTSFNLNPWLPAEDLVQTAKNILAGDWDAVKDTNPLMSLNRSPLLNAGAEIITGHDTLTGAKSEGAFSAVQKNFLPSWLPGGYQAKRLMQGFTRNQEGELGVTDAQGRKETPLSGIGALMGISVEKYDKKRLMQRVQLDQDAAVQAARSDLKRILRSDTNNEERNAAEERYIEKVKQIKKLP